VHAPTDPFHVGALAPTAPGKSAPMLVGYNSVADITGLSSFV